MSTKLPRILKGRTTFGIGLLAVGVIAIIVLAVFFADGDGTDTRELIALPIQFTIDADAVTPSPSGSGTEADFDDSLAQLALLEESDGVVARDLEPVLARTAAPAPPVITREPTGVVDYAEPEAALAESDGSLPPIPPALPGALEPLSGRRPSNKVRRVFRIWVVIFALVGAQMGWVLRPFVGGPTTPFEWFRARESNFFMAVMETLKNLLGIGG